MDYPAEVRYEVYDAIIEYAASGRLSELKPLAKMAFSFIKKEMDDYQRKQVEKLGRNRENGRKGGAPKGNVNAMKTTENNPKQPKTTENNPKQPKTTENNRKQPKTTETTKVPYTCARVSHSHEDNILLYNLSKKSTNVPKESENERKLEDARGQSEPYNRLTDMLSRDCPYISGHYTHLVSEEELGRLLEKYSEDFILDTIQQIENRVDLRKRYTNLYRTLLNWLKREKEQENAKDTNRHEDRRRGYEVTADGEKDYNSSF